MIQLSKNTFLFFRLGIAVLAYGFIIYKLCGLSWLEIVSVFEASIVNNNPLFLILFIVLMPVNWLLEAIKWKFSLKNFEKIGLLDAYKSVWYGIVTGVITPNRIGEPLGRVALVSSSNRVKAILVAYWCSASQQVATVFFGLIGIAIWGYSTNLKEKLSFNSVPYIALIALALLALLFFILKINSISTYLSKNRFAKRCLSGETINLNISITQSFLVVGVSLIRYLIFSSQFILILLFLGVNAKISLLFSAISLTYLATNFIPTFFFSEAGVRAGVALAFIGSLTSNSIAVASGTILLWILNLGIPATIATWFPWYRKKFQNKRN